jgi:hypothetical protein
MFKFVKIVIALVVLVVAGAFLYDRWQKGNCEEEACC